MAVDLKRTYWMLLLPAIFGFVLVSALQYFNFLGLGSYSYPSAQLLAPLLFILCGIFAIGLPIFYRTLFASKMRQQTSTPEAVWLKFERNLILFALAAPYVTLLAHLLRLPRFHLAGMILMALYAVYYYYPSDRRIAFERRIFRVR